MTNNPFLDVELAALRQADLRREAAEHRIAKEARRGRKERRLARRLRALIRPARNPKTAPRVVVRGTPGGGRA